MEQLSPDHLVATAERTILFVVRSPPPRSVVSALEAYGHNVARSHRAPLAYLHVVLDVPTTGRVDDDTRKALIESGKRSLHLFEGAAMVLLGQGFIGAAMRAMVSAALLVVRPRVPVRIFPTVEEGARWVSSFGSPSHLRRDEWKLGSIVAEMSSRLSKR